MRIKHSGMSGCTLDNKFLSEAAQKQEFGSIIPADLNQSVHINLLARRANGRLSILRRTLGSLLCDIFTQMYALLVQPLLEQRMLVQPTFSKKDKLALHTVQCTATKNEGEGENKTHGF